jgi:hypothetical protein
MKDTVILLFLSAVTLAGCVNDDVVGKSKSDSDCSTAATVVNLTAKLDGCGWVFKLEDGSMLEPIIYWCGTPPISEEQQNYPLNGFEWVDGKKVMIDYEVVPSGVSICMGGPIVRITCLSEPELPSHD